MLPEKVQEGLNDQMAAEFYSAHLYLSMSAYLHSIDMPGAANWMRVQYEEELTHALKIFDFIIERDGRAIVKSFDPPPSEWSSPLDAFYKAYLHEQKVTSSVGELLELARREHDHATEFFLQWFVNEQVEEEASVKAIVQQLKLVGDSKNGIFMIDRELGNRKFVPPTE